MSKQNDELKKELKDNTRYRRWCITCFDMDNYPTKDSFMAHITTSQVKFAIVGAEITSLNEKPHYQCYVEYLNGRTFNAMHKDFPKMHLETAQGSCNQNLNYCTKEDKDALVVGHPNITDNILGKGDIASNLVDYMFSKQGKCTLPEIIRVCPDMADYIVRNYKNLTEILSDIRESCKQDLFESVEYQCNPKQQCMVVEDINPDIGLPF